MAVGQEILSAELFADDLTDFTDEGNESAQEASPVPSTALQQAPSDAQQSSEPATPGEATDTPHPAEQKRYADLWDRIRDGFSLPPLDDPRVAFHERWFASNPQYMDRKMERARLYLYYIVQEIEKRGMPMEIALLPAIESAYQPHAYSRARALGLWQFIAPTARKYGIEMNWWYDGRQDVLASTRAALDYLQKLHEEFNDWNLALAAYNAGEGRVHYAIEYNRRKGRPTDYQHLRLRAETLHYVPKLMALVNIVSNPEAYGIQLASIPNEPYFVPVNVGSQIDLNVIAELADVPVGDLYDINPGFKRWATAPDGPHRILVPIDKREQLIEGLNSLPEESRIKWRRHRVSNGDTLSTIARRYGVTVSAIMRANHLRGTLIRVNQNLLIPISTRRLSLQVANVTRPVRASYTPPASQAKVVHRVRYGETLWSIARQYRVYVSQLAKWNFIRPQDILQTGQTLNIWISP
jgi:membrane-bound lytic murein transglycosylase D